MRDLLTIGQFSNLTQLTVKALRLYDRLGVLRPAVVDLSSGYRYYGLDQVGTAKRIYLLRSIDMPLAEIRSLLGESNPETLRKHLVRHRQTIEMRIAAYRDGLALLETLDDWAEAIGMEQSREPGRNDYECAFCGEPNTTVNRMIAGRNGGLICDQCVAKCSRLLAEEEHSTPGPDSDG